MAGKYKLLLAAYVCLLLASGQARYAQGDPNIYKFETAEARREGSIPQEPLPSGDEYVMKNLNVPFYSLVKDIQKNFPVTADYLRSVGFTIIGWNSPDITMYYKCEDVSLLDGVRLEKIEFRIVKGTKKEGSLFIFHVQGKDVLRHDLEERVGIFSLYDTPTGRSGNERITYIKRVGKYSLRAEYDQQVPNVLRALYFDSITSIQ